MNATSRDLPGADMAETVVYEPNEPSGREWPPESPDMPNPNAQGNHRYTFNSGARPLDGYTIKRAIGRGGFGEVYYATSDSGKEVALKLILRNLDVERRGVVQCMNLKCPNLLTIYDLKSTDAGDAFVIMEYVAGPSLANVLSRYPKGMPVAEVRAWLKGLIDGVAYLHDHGIVHRDLKPANMFMEEGIVKIGDYGLAKLINTSQGSEHSESIGTCHYMAPEIASGKYNKPIDVYAIGVILFEMLTGRVPFEGESVGEVLMKHLTARPDLSSLEEPYKTIVGRALSKDPNHRPAQLFDLLPPEDAPKAPPVRFIGDGKVSPPLPPAPEVVIKEEEEDVLRIGPEEPIFYIGPDTRPPRRPGPAISQRLRANWASLRRPVAARPAVQHRGAQQRGRRAPEPPPAPAPPPPLPSGRIRVAELATALLWASILTGLCTVGTVAAFGVDLIHSSAPPMQALMLFVLALVGSWAVLIQEKALEGRGFERTTRRLANLGVGAMLGATGIVLDEWLRLGPAPWGVFPRPSTEFVNWFHPVSMQTSSLYYLGYFALLFLFSGGWAKLAARDRKKRFRVMPVIGSAVIAGLLLPIWPYAEPYGIAVAAIVPIVTQLVSPWSEAAAAYAAANKKRRSAVA
ncbi:serine/threonine-protein kinase [Singulisphaera sp. PoT]|uniref:serine/threonine-protein kinase n=1 Tax=Singulisphaera sp. PoT TaxID=3411797 RepID=UPI003BF47352